jgi:hypothetical protein
MIIPVSALRPVRVGPLLEGVGPLRKADADHRVAGLENVGAAVLRRRRCQPGLDEIVDERIVRPFGDLVAECVDVLQRPVGVVSLRFVVVPNQCGTVRVVGSTEAPPMVVERGLSCESSMTIGSTALAEAAKSVRSTSATADEHSREISKHGFLLSVELGCTENGVRTVSKIIVGVKGSGTDLTRCLLEADPPCAVERRSQERCTIRIVCHMFPQ